MNELNYVRASKFRAGFNLKIDIKFERDNVKNRQTTIVLNILKKVRIDIGIPKS